MSENAYSIMAADEVRVVQAGPVVGEVAVRGRLMDRGGQLAGRIPANDARHLGQPRRRNRTGNRSPPRAGRRSVGLILSPPDSPGRRTLRDPIAASTRQPWPAKPRDWRPRSSSKSAVNTGRSTILTAGLPYHRRWACGSSIRVDRSRRERAAFRFGIGIDLPHPQTAAPGFLAPSPAAPLAGVPKKRVGLALPPRQSRRSWPRIGRRSSRDGAAAGVRVRLLETERPARHARAAVVPRGENGPASSAVTMVPRPSRFTIAGDMVTVPVTAL